MVSDTQEVLVVTQGPEVLPPDTQDELLHWREPGMSPLLSTSPVYLRSWGGDRERISAKGYSIALSLQEPESAPSRPLQQLWHSEGHAAHTHVTL